MPVSTDTFNAASLHAAASAELQFVRVFCAGADGGNPAPVSLNAELLSADDMMAVARTYGHESAFVCTPRDAANAFRFRFFVPNHEMEMCGHATLGALWLLRRSGAWTSHTATIETISGLVEARFDTHTRDIQISQPNGTVTPIQNAALIARTLDALGLRNDELLPLGIVNAATSRAKTLVPVASIERLHQLLPRWERVEALCDALDSTGLYPFAVDPREPLCLHSRQFPRASGYPEDAATGIAAAASIYGAKHYGLIPQGASGITVMQGYAMGKPSRIHVEWRDPEDPSAGCRLSGAVELTQLEPVQ